MQTPLPKAAGTVPTSLPTQPQEPRSPEALEVWGWRNSTVSLYPPPHLPKGLATGTEGPLQTKGRQLRLWSSAASIPPAEHTHTADPRGCARRHPQGCSRLLLFSPLLAPPPQCPVPPPGLAAEVRIPGPPRRPFSRSRLTWGAPPAAPGGRALRRTRRCGRGAAGGAAASPSPRPRPRVPAVGWRACSGRGACAVVSAPVRSGRCGARGTARAWREVGRAGLQRCPGCARVPFRPLRGGMQSSRGAKGDGGGGWGTGRGGQLGYFERKNLSRSWNPLGSIFLPLATKNKQTTNDLLRPKQTTVSVTIIFMVSWHLTSSPVLKYFSKPNLFKHAEIDQN